MCRIISLTSLSLLIHYFWGKRKRGGFNENLKFALSFVYNSPIVGIVVTISSNFSLYRIVVLPAPSNPIINILISFLPIKLLKNLRGFFHMAVCCQEQRLKLINPVNEIQKIRNFQHTRYNKNNESFIFRYTTLSYTVSL